MLEFERFGANFWEYFKVDTLEKFRACSSFGQITREFWEHFCAHFGQVLGMLAGAWCDTGQADDSVDSLMHGHTMWQSRHGWKREAAPFDRAPSPTPSRLQKLTTQGRQNFAQGPGQTARSSLCMTESERQHLKTKKSLLSWQRGDRLRVWAQGDRGRVAAAAGGLHAFRRTQTMAPMMADGFAFPI